MNIKKFRKRLYYRMWSLIPRKRLRPAAEPIDIVIPILPRDLYKLPLCLEGIRHCVCHTVKAIYVVSPNDDAVKKFCSDNSLVFIDENEIFDFTASDLNIKVEPNGEDRSGWLFQQMIKLSGKVGTCDHYLCIDADHVLLRPHVFLTDDGRTVFYKSSECHQPYLDNIEKLTGWHKFSRLSYVAHKMCFDRNEVKKLQKLIEDRAGGKTWTQAIADSYDRKQNSGFSEFQLYGHYISNKVERPWLNHGLRKGKIAPYDILVRRYGRFLAAVTFPEYKI